MGTVKRPRIDFERSTDLRDSFNDTESKMKRIAPVKTDVATSALAPATIPETFLISM
jgi:hypothetical protein